MNRILNYLFHPKRNPRYEELEKIGLHDAMYVSLLMSPVIAAAITIFLLMSLLWNDQYVKTSLLTGYRIGYCVILVALILHEVLILYVRKNYDLRYRILPPTNVFMTILLLGWAIWNSELDYISYGRRVEATLFIIISICIPFCLYLDTRLYLFFTLLSDGVMISLFLRDGVDAAFNHSDLGDFLVFICIQLFIGVIVFYYKYTVRENMLKQEEQKKEIRKLNESQNRFFSNMSHEIRTPINTIIGLNEMILRQNASKEINEDAENIQAASKMLLHLINDILDMSKFETGQMELNPAPYRIGDMLSDIVGMLWIRAKEKNLAFYVDVSPDLPSELFGDDMRIKQILINVLNNAIKYTQEGSVRLSIQCERDGAGSALISFSISDTGMGIKKESIPYLFTAFKRVDTDKNKYIEGTGLGLSIVKQFVDLMDGKITVNSVYTKGSTFVIEIPQRIVNDEPLGEIDAMSREQVQKDHTYVESFEAPEAEVLVVDDTAANLMVVSKLLRGTKVKLDLVSSGAEALNKTMEKMYHVILMDHKMPGMDGIECTHAIRTQIGGHCHDSKIIALTANAGSETRTLYMKEGFDGYLMKPVTGEELENTVYRFIPKELVTVVRSATDLADESIAWVREHRKKARIKVTTESVADIPRELLEKYNIAQIPYGVRTNYGLFKDGLEIETSSLLSYMEHPDATATSVSPTEEEYTAFFSRQLDDANNIIHISITDQVAHASIPAAMAAAEDFGNVTVINSLHVSGGLGLMVIEAARLADEGLDVSQIVERLEKMKWHVNTSFIVDTLDFLTRQKQVSDRVGHLADAFMVHPVISVKKGKLGITGFYFGSLENSWQKYINKALRVPGKIDRRLLFITYAGLTARELNKIREIVESKIKFDEIYIQKASATIAANCGPGTFGLLFFTEY